MLSKKEVQNIAILSRIGLDEKETEEYRKDISAILDYFKKLEEINTDEIEPVGHIIDAENIFYSDMVKNSDDLERAEILKNAPNKKDGYLKVKSIL